MNFKYKAALLSSNTDLNHNDEEMLNLGTKLFMQIQKFYQLKMRSKLYKTSCKRL